MNNIRFGATNSLARDVAGSTVAQVLRNAGISGALGFGSSVCAKINGVPVDENYVIRGGETIDIENKAQSKAADVTVTVRFGATATLTRAFPATTTIRSVLTRPDIKAALGYGENAVAKINGVAVRDDLYVSEGMRIDIETRAQEKAVA